MKRNNQPPQWILNWLERFCDPLLIEGIAGDLDEVFKEHLESRGKFMAQLIYLFQALGFMRFIFKRKNKKVSNMKAIWINYLLTSYRSLKRHKVFFGINVIGLIMAITCSLYALIFINDELQYDSHLEGEGIYRLYKRHINVPEKIDILTYETSGMMGPTMTEEYPEVLSFSRVLPWWDPMIFTFNETSIENEHVVFTDSSFIDLFKVDMLSGVNTNPLAAPSSIILSESLAKSLFGDEEPIGQSVVGVNDLKFTVTGIFKSAPRHSSMQYDALISWTTTVPGIGPMGQTWMNNWLAQGIFTFVKLDEGASPALLEEKLPEMMNVHFEERAENYFLKLQPLAEMYLYGDGIRHSRGMKSGSIQFIKLLGFSALLIFLIACVNYINIALSRASQTHTEVGIRKAMGSSRNQLMGRFVSETFISTLMASLISFLIVYILIPKGNMILDKDIPQSILYGPIGLLSLLSFILGISICVGVYPALVLSSQPLSTILKNASGTVKGTGWFRKVLLTLQYSISIFLIICTIAVIRQTNFLLNRPLGFDKEQVLVVDINNEVGDKMEVFRSKLLTHPNIQSVSAGRSAIGGGSYTTRVTPDGYEGEVGARMFGVDFYFFETYGIETQEGRSFRVGSSADSTNSLMVNKAFVDFVGWDDPIGKQITFSSGNSYPIIGITNNFHISSLATSDIEPMIMFLNFSPNYASVKIGAGDIRETIGFIADTYDEFAKRTPLNYYFVDEWYDEQYSKESQLLSIATVYSIISIILCALGLYGLTALILQQRQKEISIRKVLGATIGSIVSLVNKQFILIIGISFLIAAPLSWYLIIDWLENFVYKIEVGIIPFIIASGLTVLVSLLIISGLSVKTANANPSETLSNE